MRKWFKDELDRAIEDVTVDPFWLPLGILTMVGVVLYLGLWG